MFYSRQIGPNHKIPLRTKLTLAFWVILSLALLSVFAFGIFLIALIVGAIVFTTNLFQKKNVTGSIPQPPNTFTSRPYSSHQNIKNDDDVIDI